MSEVNGHSDAMQVDSPSAVVPTTLEQDLFGDEDEQQQQQSVVPASVRAHDAVDLDDQPAPSQTGVQSIVRSDNGNDNDDDDDDDDDDGGLFGGEDDEVPKTPEQLDESVTDAKHQVSQFDREDKERFADYLGTDEQGITDEERARRRALEYEEDDGGRPGEDDDEYYTEKQESIAQLEFAAFPVPATQKVWHARLPNFLSLAPTPFDDLLWDPEDDRSANQKEGHGEEEGAPKPIVEDEHFIRWRWAKDSQGRPVKETNSRIVRWSDSSLSLQIGSELFDINASIDMSGLANSAVPPTAQASLTPTTMDLSRFDVDKPHGLTYLVTEHQYRDLLEAQASIYGTMTFRPSNLQSDSHRRLAGNIAKRYQKKTRSKMAMTSEDPEKKKLEREKAELEKTRKANRANRSRTASTKQKRRQTRFEDFYGDGDDDDVDDDKFDRDDRSDLDDNGADEGLERKSARSRRGNLGGRQRYNEDDEEDDGFVVNDEDEDAEDAEGMEDEADDNLDNLEKQAERAKERDDRRRKEAAASSDREERSLVPSVTPRRRMVVESDEEGEE